MTTPEEQAKTLFTVESTAPFIHSLHNTRFRVSEALHFPTDDFASRSATPSEGEGSTPAPEVQIKTYLRFTVDNIGNQTSFVFGSERESCDIYVYAATKISRQLFAVELENNGRSAMLKNLSRYGTDIESPIYDRQRFRQKRALHPGDQVAITTAACSSRVWPTTTTNDGDDTSPKT